MSYTPINSDATNVAAYTIARLNATSPSSGAVTSDEAVAIADSYLGALGGLGPTFISDAASLGPIAGGYSITAYNPVGNGTTTGFPTWTTPSIPIAKTYWLWCICSCYVTVGGGRVFFRFNVDGSAPAGQPATAQRLFFNTVNQQLKFMFCAPVSLTTGTHVVKLEWQVDIGVTAQADANDGRTFWITG
jgi:hypothetical protein